MDSRRSHKPVVLPDLSIYCTLKNKKLYENNKHKYQEQHGGEVFELPDESYSAAKTQDGLQYIIKKKETLTNKLPV